MTFQVSGAHVPGVIVADEMGLVVVAGGVGEVGEGEALGVPARDAQEAVDGGELLGGRAHPTPKAFLEGVLADGELLREALNAHAARRARTAASTSGSAGTWRMRRNFRAFAPTGQRVTNTAIVICRLEAGKVVESWLEADRLGVLQAIGAVPRQLTAAPVRP